jgi:hypothetical protein
MKTKLILTATLFTFVMAGFAIVGEHKQLSNNCDNPLQNSHLVDPSEILLKGIITDGKVIPLVELQEVIINGKREPKTLTNANSANGEVVSVSNVEVANI